MLEKPHGLVPQEKLSVCAFNGEKCKFSTRAAHPKQGPRCDIFWVFEHFMVTFFGGQPKWQFTSLLFVRPFFQTYPLLFWGGYLCFPRTSASTNTLVLVAKSKRIILEKRKRGNPNFLVGFVLSDGNPKRRVRMGIPKRFCA